jgi:hypothetical protein
MMSMFLTSATKWDVVAMDKMGKYVKKTSWKTFQMAAYFITSQVPRELTSSLNSDSCKVLIAHLSCLRTRTLYLEAGTTFTGCRALRYGQNSLDHCNNILGHPV